MSESHNTLGISAQLLSPRIDSKITNPEAMPLLRETDTKSEQAESKLNSSVSTQVENRPSFRQELSENVDRLSSILVMEEWMKNRELTELNRNNRERVWKEFLKPLKEQHNKVFYEALNNAVATNYFSQNPEKRRVIKEYLEACYAFLASDLINNRSMETHAHFPLTLNDAKQPVASVFKGCTDGFGACTKQSMSTFRARASLFFCGQHLSSLVSDSYDPPSLKCALTTVESCVILSSLCAAFCALGSSIPPSMLVMIAILPPSSVSLMIGMGLYYSSETTRNKLNMLQYIFDHYQQLHATVYQERLKNLASVSATDIMTREDSPTLSDPSIRRGVMR